ncbi:MAG: transporter substrate-binding domain-containing protein, partial [Succinivibrio sp.]
MTNITRKHALACAVALALLGTATLAQADAKDKVLHVGCEGAFAPFTYIDDAGKITGFDIDLIRQLGKDMGYKVDIQVYPFDGLIPALLTDSIDVIISGFTISEERAKKVDFSDPYYLCGLTYLVK